MDFNRNQWYNRQKGLREGIKDDKQCDDTGRRTWIYVRFPHTFSFDRIYYIYNRKEMIRGLYSPYFAVSSHFDA